MKGVKYQLVRITDPEDLSRQLLVLDDATKEQIIEHLQRQDEDYWFEYSVAAYDYGQISECGPERLGSMAGDEFMADPTKFPWLVS